MKFVPGDFSSSVTDFHGTLSRERRYDIMKGKSIKMRGSNAYW